MFDVHACGFVYRTFYSMMFLFSQWVHRDEFPVESSGKISGDFSETSPEIWAIEEI